MRKIFKIFFINIVIVFLILFTLEFSARLFGLAGLMGITVDLIHDEKKRIHYIKPNSSGKVFGSNIFFDKFGYRVPSSNYMYKKKDKIILIGDSVTFGNGVIEEETFAGILRKSNNNFEVFNTSVFGYQVRHFNLRKDELDRFKPIKKIFYFVTLNDVFDSSNIAVKNKNEGYYENTNFKKIINLDYLRNLNIYFRDKSYFWMFLKGKIIDPQKVWFKNVLNYYQQNDPKELSVFFENLLSKSIDLKAELTIFILPYEYQTRKCGEEVLLPQKKITHILNGLKIENYDLTSVFCDQNEPKELFYKFDPMHLSENGHKIVYKEIKKRKLK